MKKDFSVVHSNFILYLHRSSYLRNLTQFGTRPLVWGYPERLKHIRGCPCGVVIKALDCGIVVSKFKLQLHYYIHFQTNNLEKGMKPLILPAMG